MSATAQEATGDPLEKLLVRRASIGLGDVNHIIDPDWPNLTLCGKRWMGTALEGKDTCLTCRAALAAAMGRAIAKAVRRATGGGK